MATSDAILQPVYFCDAVRTPFGRYGGALAGVRTDDLAAEPLRALQARNPSVDWGALDDVILGCANQAGEDNRNVARMALLLAGLPDRVPGATVNRLCASSLDACITGARADRGGGDVARDRRRRREHVAGAVRDGQAGRGLRPRPGLGRHHARLALRQPADAGAIRHRLDAGDRRARRRRARHRPRGSGSVRAAQPAAGRRGGGRRAVRRRDRPDRHPSIEGPGSRGRGRRAPAAGDDPGVAGEAPADRPPGRHGHGRQRLGHQRRQLRAAARVGGRGAGARPDAPRALRGRGGRGRAAARDGHRSGARGREAARPHRPHASIAWT